MMNIYEFKNRLLSELDDSFIQVLKDNDVLDDYLDYTWDEAIHPDCYYHLGDPEDHLDNLLTEYKHNELIWSFDWEKSKQGYDFWRDIAKESCEDHEI